MLPTRSKTLLTCAVLTLCSIPVSAGTNKLMMIGPGPNAGEIVVAGTFTPDAGWDIAKDAKVKVWPVFKDGSVADDPITVTVDVKTGAWSKTVTGLTSGQEYWVYIECTESKLEDMVIMFASYNTTIATVKAK